MKTLVLHRQLATAAFLTSLLAAAAQAQHDGALPAADVYRPRRVFPVRPVLPAGYEPLPPPFETATATGHSNRDPYLQLVQSDSDKSGAPGPANDGDAPSDDEDSLEARLTKLEDLFEEQQEEARKPEPDLWKPTLKINGRLHFDYWNFPEDSPGIGFFENPDTGTDVEDRFLFRRVRLEMGGDISALMPWRMQVEFSEANNPELRDAYFGFRDLPVLQTLLIGNQKRPLGLDTIESSRYTVFMERPTVNDAFNEDFRRFGVASYGISDDLVYNWRYGIYLLEDIVDDGASIGDTQQFSLNGRLAATPWYDEVTDGRSYLHLGAATMLAFPDGDVDPDDTNLNEARFRTRSEVRSSLRWLDTGRIPLAETYNINGLEFLLNIGELQIASEYMTNNVYRNGAADDLFFHGAYAYVAYMLTGEHMPWDRETGQLGRLVPFENFFLVERCCGRAGGGWGAWQVAARVSWVDLTDEDIHGGVGNNTTLGMNWYWTPHSRMQFNAVYGDIRDHAPIEGFTGGHFVGLGTRMMVDF